MTFKNKSEKKPTEEKKNEIEVFLESPVICSNLVNINF